MRRVLAFIALAFFLSCAPKALDVQGAKSSSSNHSSSADWILPGNPFQIDENVNDGVGGIERPETELTAPAGNKEIVAKAGVMTASLVTANRVLMSLASCSGIGRPSDRSRQMWQEKYGSFSVEGRANSITAPMLMAQTALAAEVCLDIIETERNSNQRRIFASVDFNSSVNSNDLSDVVRRLARSCWGRNETDAEKNMLINETMNAFPAGTNAEDPMIFLCTSMLSSVSAMQM